MAKKVASQNGRDRLEEAIALLINNEAASIIQVLNEHTRILERLPDTLRDKIGFKSLQ
ncbi:MAG: hypothetical protein ACREHD_12890 [Pirellulales bacterium]